MGRTMTLDELVAIFHADVPSEPDSHIMWWMMQQLREGTVLPFMRGLLEQLLHIELASPGYSIRCIQKISGIPGITDASREALYQIIGEIYCAGGAVEVADRETNGAMAFINEPFAQTGLKNPEFESQYAGLRYAVEVKTPSLIHHRRQRATNPIQINTRLPRGVFAEETRTFPRDNPVKDFLISADEKFAAYRAEKPDPFRILSIVWDNFVNEPIAALTSPVSGLFTDQSFHRQSSGDREAYANLDGVVIIPYQHQILNTFANTEFR
jgi:hypothetical protein